MSYNKITKSRRSKTHLMEMSRQNFETTVRKARFAMLALQRGLKASVKGDIILDSSGSIDVNKKRLISQEMHKCLSWLSQLGRMAAQINNIGLEDFVEKTIKDEALLKAQILMDEVPVDEHDALNYFCSFIKSKVSGTKLVYDEEIKRILTQKIKGQIDVAVMEVAEDIHEDRAANIRKRLEESDEDEDEDEKPDEEKGDEEDSEKDEEGGDGNEEQNGV
ncbi:hypothetical protein D6D05_00990 [Aureobasidium pullulans]|nr:hypothetical protein D6D05_00990 [Aureobasidium pullulans]